MARVLQVSGQCVEPFEAAVVRYLARYLPDQYALMHNVDLPNERQGGSLDLDVVVIGPTGLFLVEVKNWFGTLENRDQDRWQLVRRLPNGGEESVTRCRADRAIAHKVRVLFSHLTSHLYEGKREPLWRPEYPATGCVVFPDPPHLRLNVPLNRAAALHHLRDLAGFLLEPPNHRHRPRLGESTVEHLLRYLGQHLGGYREVDESLYQHYAKVRKLWSVEEPTLGYRTEAFHARNVRLEHKDVQLLTFTVVDTSRSYSDRKLTWQHLEKTKRALLRLNHPATPRVMSEGGERQTRELWLEVDPPAAVLRGISVSDLLQDHRERRTPVPLAFVANLFTQLVDALEHAHKQQVYHRGLTPDNVFVLEQEDGRVQIGISDFGMARIGGYPAVGTPFRSGPYTPPELVDGTVRGPDTPVEEFIKMDVYCVGALLLECLTLTDLRTQWADGRPLALFDPGGIIPGMTRHGEPEASWYWGELGFDVRQMLAEPRDRMASFHDLKQVLSLFQ